LQALPILEDSVIADIGAGTGYFVLPMARRAPLGRVYAVDIQQEMLDIVRSRTQEENLSNIIPVLSTIDNPKLPENSLDLVLIVDAYHEFSHPYEMLQGIYSALKRGGKLVLIEYRKEDPSVMIKPLHKMTEKQAIKELEAAGFNWTETSSILPQQHYLVFTKP